MATYVGGPSYALSGEDLGRFAGHQYQGPQQAALYDLFEQAFKNDPYRFAAGIDIEPYLQGINLNDPVLAGGFGNPQSIAAGQQAANQILSRMSAAGVGPAGWTPWGNFQDFNARQNARGGGFTLGSGLDDFISGGIQHLGDTASELWSEPGFRQLALTAAGGAYAGSQAAPAAGAAGTANAAAPTASTVSGASGAAGGPLYSTPATMGTNAFGGAFSTPAMTTYAGPTGTALGGFSAPAALGPGGTVLGTSVLTGGGASGGAAGVGGGAASSGGIAGVLSNPMAIGALGGAALGGLGGSQQAGTIQTQEGIPDWLMPYVKPQLDKYSTDLQNYQIDPYGVMPSAMKEFQNTISGRYLDPSTNKYLEDYFKLGSERIKGSLSPSFGHMQAFGAHSGYNEALSRGLGDFATGLYGGEYGKERDRMSQMTLSAPNFIGQSGTAAFAPYQQYLQTVGSLGKKKDQPFFENQFGNILGGAMVGGSLGNIWR